MKCGAMVRVWRLGLMSFDTAFSIQKALVRRQLDAVAAGSTGRDTLLLVEHKPVYTIGIRDATPQSEINRLLELGADFRKTNRGGLITFHGPGQLVAYPILCLKNYKPSVKWYVCSLEETIIRLCSDYGLKGTRSPDTGVWIGDNKMAAIGIHASRYVTSHGVSLNCNTNLTWFEHIVPCGIVGKGVTSLTKETGQNVDVHSTVPVFLKHFEEVFECRTEEMTKDEQEDVLNHIFSNLMTPQVL